MTAMLKAALAYAARGWPVFPCQPGSKQPAGRLVPHGVLEATTDEAQIRAWWTAQPDANVAIATGAPGPDVLDIDVKAEGSGYHALAELTAAGLASAAGYVMTPSGGLHAYFAGTSQRNGSLRGHHIDYRGTGGYVIAPPSTVGGVAYVTTRTAGELATAADWAAIRAHLEPPPDPPAFHQPARDPGHVDRHTGRPGDDWAATTSWAQLLEPHGWRRTRDLGGGRAMWRRPGKTDGSSATTRDDGGLYVFSTSTGFEPEVPYTKFGALAVLEHGGDHTAAAAALRRAGFGEPLTAIGPATGQLEAGTPGDGSEWWAQIAARHQPVDWHQLWEDTPDDEDWLLEPLLAAGRSIALYSPPKAGKSLLMLEITAALITGRPVLGQPAGPPRKVLYVDLENSRRDLRDRLTALGYKPADLTSLIYLSFPSLPVLDSAQGGQEIVALAMAHKADAVVIDTVSRVISGKENDADTFAALYRYAMAPLKGLGIAVARLDHAGKDLGRGQRGSSAKNADVDAVWNLTATADGSVILECDMSRTVLPTMMVRLKREAGPPLRHQLATSAAPLTKTQVLMAKLDELEVPRDHGFSRCRTALNQAGVPVDTNDLKAAIRTRKLQPDLSDDLDPESGSQTGFSDRPTPSAYLSEDLQTGADETAGQTCLKDHQTGSDTPVSGEQKRHLSENPPTPKVWGFRQVSAAQPDHPGICTGCGEPQHPGRACFATRAAL